MCVITLLTFTEYDGREDGRGGAECVYSAKVLALAALWRWVLAKNAGAIAANFGSGWHNFWEGAAGDDACGAGWGGWTDGMWGC
jgi:APA family basic amino acid/polyamine antiporter